MDLEIIFQYSVVFTDFLEASLESFLLHVLGGIAALQDLVWVRSFLCLASWVGFADSGIFCLLISWLTLVFGAHSPVGL